MGDISIHDQTNLDSVTHPNKFLEDGTFLDHIFVKGIFQTSAGIIASPICDHFPTIMSFHDNNIKCKLTKTDIFIYWN